MENIIMLPAKDYEADRQRIEETWQDGPVYVLDNEKEALHEYLDYLYDECGLPVDILYAMRICKQQELAKGSVTLVQHGEERKPGSVAELLGMLDDQGTASIVIETDDRVLLANILQQPIYIDYPITRVDMKLRKEYKDAEKTKRFMDRVVSLQEFAKKAADLIGELYIGADEKNAEELLRIRADAIAAYSRIGEQIDKARGVEMKVAVAASKKTGKSVIVNSMLGMELAPTSNELATPNNCIYRKSVNGGFHLDYKGTTEDYTEAGELHQRINREFKEAQKHKEEGFAIPDMTISYVSEGSNFDSYTIYDTPGPDAKGTIHEEAAKAAMRQCDVAVFAIDYSKYLIPTEVEYLEEIKNMFEEKGKFHSLIFVINKLDLAMADKGSKSRVKSIDFIRNRLRDIDERYGDCVIFATSAQDYFYTVEMEHAARDGKPFAEPLQPLVQPDADLDRGLNDLLRDPASRNMDRDLKTVLSNLRSEAGRIGVQLGYTNFSLQDMKDYSGMPQLMSHIAYVAQSKAREEIVNGITFAIDQQQKSLQAIIDGIANLESLMNANDDQVRRIKEILEGFRQEIAPWLRPAVTEEETAGGFLRESSALEATVRDLGRNGYPVDLKAALGVISVDIENAASESDILKGVWNEYKPAQMKRIREARGLDCTKAQLNKALSLSSDELNGIITTYLRNMLQSDKDSLDKDVKSVRDCLQEILRRRMEKLRTATDSCQEQLDKTGVTLQLPALPEFDCAISLQAFSANGEFDVFNRKKKETGGMFVRWGSVADFFINLFSDKHSWGDVNGFVRTDLSESQIDKAVDNVYKQFSDAMSDAGVYMKFKGKLAELAENVEGVRDELDRNFENITETCHGSIDTFEGMIDDRGRFQEENEALARMKALICGIQNASADFLSVWDEIMG